MEADIKCSFGWGTRATQKAISQLDTSPVDVERAPDASRMLSLILNAVTNAILQSSRQAQSNDIIHYLQHLGNKMKQHFPVSQSNLSANALGDFVAESYALPKLVKASFLASGLNHSYLLEAVDKQKYVLRVYRLSWRSLDDILYELEALISMSSKGANVSTPLAATSGSYVHELAAPEGTRYAVLFTYAPGLETRHEEVQVTTYGKNAALVHNATEGFSSQYSRYALDAKHLIEEPLESISRRLTNDADSSYIKELAGRLQSRLSSLPQEQLDMGFCHGDFHAGNAHMTQEGEFTFIDFDCCGYGFRAYDLAVYQWDLDLLEITGCWHDFITAYKSVREVSELDLSSIPLFVAIRQLWFIGLHTEYAHQWGEGYLDTRFLPKEIERLRKFDSELLSS